MPKGGLNLVENSGYFVLLPIHPHPGNTWLRIITAAVNDHQAQLISPRGTV